VDLNWRLGAWIDRKIRYQKSYYSVLAYCAIFEAYKGGKTRSLAQY